MNKTLALVASVVAIAFAAPVLAADVAGTATTKTETKVETATDGSSEKTTETKTVSDPKCLMNKETTKTKDVVKTDAAGAVVKKEHEKKVDGHTTEKTTEEKK